MAEETSLAVSLENTLTNVKDGLPADFNIQRFVNNSVALIQGNKQLIEYGKKYGVGQIKAGLLKGAYLGLDAMNNEFYLVQYGNDLNFMMDYRGAVKLAKKYSIRPVLDIYAKLVRKGDKYEESIVDGQPKLTFKPIPFNDGEIVGAFAVCMFKDGGIVFDTMSKSDLDRTRAKSKASNSMAWKDFEGEMYKKTVLHRLTKHLELCFDSLDQKKIYDDDTESADFSRQTAVVENPFAEPETQDDVVAEGGVVEDGV